MTSLHEICGLGPPQSKILATPMPDIHVYLVLFDAKKCIKLSKTNNDMHNVFFFQNENVAVFS